MAEHRASLEALTKALASLTSAPEIERCPAAGLTVQPDGGVELAGPLPAADLWPLARVFAHTGWVTALRAPGAAIDALGAAALAHSLAQWTPHKALVLDENPLQDGGALAIFEALARAPRAVECLSMRACRVGPSSVEGLASLLAARAPSAIDLRANSLAPQAIEWVTRALPAGAEHTVRVLRVGGCARGEGLAGALVAGFASPRAPWRLDLAKSELRDAGAARLASALALPGAPTELVLDENLLGERALVALIEALAHPACRVRVLSLRGNALGPEVRALVEAPSLVALHLDHCALDHETREALCRGALANPALRTLSIAHEDGPVAGEPAAQARAALHARTPEEPSRWAQVLARRCRSGRAAAAPEAPARVLDHATRLRDEDFDAAARVLRVLASPEGRTLAPERMPPGLAALVTAAAERIDHERQEARLRARAERRAEDRAQIARTAMHRAQIASRGPAIAEAPAGQAPPLALHKSFGCYACGARYRALDALYHRLCPDCASHARAMREGTADLAGRVAVLTGARVRVGYQTALKLLRAGATVVATSRFPREAARRFALEPDYETFAPRLSLHGLDLRFPRDVERFAAHLRATLPRLDVLVHNAAQTVARPAGFYAPLVERERAPLALPSDARVVSRAVTPSTSDLPALSHAEALAFPSESDDGQGQPLDLREENSWTLRLGSVSTAELLGAQAVNAVAPFVLTNALLSLIEASGPGPRCVVFVSAEEGRFSRTSALGVHPHTNMAKAAVNMLVRTSAEELAARGIFLTAVDTGWVSAQGPLPATGAARARGVTPPLDEVDGAARVCDPVFRAFRGEGAPWGVLLRNGRPSAW